MYWVAVIAAVASIIGAGVSFVSARSALHHASRVEKARHRIAALDAQIERFREDHLRVMSQMPPSDVLAVGRVLSALDLLRTNPMASPRLADAAEKLGNSIAHWMPGRPVPAIDPEMDTLRLEVREALNDAEARREALLAELEAGEPFTFVFWARKRSGP